MTINKALVIVLVIGAIMISAGLVYMFFLAPPTVAGTVPVNDKTNVPLDTTIKVNFTKPVEFGNNYIELKKSDGTLVTTKRSIKNNTLYVNPDTNLAKGSQYTLVIHTGSVTDLSSNEVPAYTLHFTTKS